MDLGEREALKEDPLELGALSGVPSGEARRRAGEVAGVELSQLGRQGAEGRRLLSAERSGSPVRPGGVPPAQELVALGKGGLKRRSCK